MSTVHKIGSNMSFSGSSNAAESRYNLKAGVAPGSRANSVQHGDCVTIGLVAGGLGCAGLLFGVGKLFGGVWSILKSPFVLLGKGFDWVKGLFGKKA